MRNDRRWISSLCLPLAGLALLAEVASAEPVVELNGHRFQVELAQQPQEFERGLSFRSSMPADRGMLFIYDSPAVAAFWMKDMEFALDILYFDEQAVLTELYPAVAPCGMFRCPVYRSAQPVKYVLELNAGTAARIGAKRGDRLSGSAVAP